MPPAKDPKAFRLPSTIRPDHVDLHIRADPDAETFDGVTSITLDLKEPTQEIVLHARGLDIEQAQIAGMPLEVALDPAREIVTFTADEPITAGRRTLTIDYRGKVAKDMAGLYLSEDGDERCLATQCEATDARAITPCFDEPTFKATWAWNITCPHRYTALSNGILDERIENDDDTTTWRFHPTPPMSSYLIACAIGDFDATVPIDHDSMTGNAVPFRVWALAGKQQYGVHANAYAARLAAWFEDYFKAPYHWNKYDQVAVPSFSFGAMENPGLVVFRAAYLLLDPKTASWSDRKAVDLVVAHEFAHMWFGNLVTMAWWDDLWLNEAFAEWIAHKAVAELSPEHEVWLPFQDRANGARSTDALESTHAIYHPIETPAQAAEMFDQITYGKGSAVMHMLEHFLGEDAFRTGLRTYMKAFAEDNAEGKDLWTHLGQASGHAVADIMTSWIAQPGHPQVSVRVERAGDKTTVHAQQERATASPDATESDQTWHVPIVLRWQDDAGTHSERMLLSDAETTRTLDTTGKVHYLHANEDDVGFYRTRYEPSALRALLEHYTTLTAAERKGLMRDQWALVRAGAPLVQHLDLLKTAMEHETHYDVTGQVVAHLRGLEGLLETYPDDADAVQALDTFRAWVGHTMSGLAHQALSDVDARSDDERISVLRAAHLRALAGIARDDAAIERARTIARRERDDPASVDANMAQAAVSISAAFGDAAHYDTHLATYEARKQAAKSPQEIERYLYTLAAPRNPTLLARTLQLCEDDTIPKQSVGPLLRIMLHEPHAQRAAWTYVREHWDQVHKELGKAWTAILVEAAGELPPDLEEEVVTFLEAHLGTQAQEAFKRARERLSERAALHTRLLPQLIDWTHELASKVPAT